MELDPELVRKVCAQDRDAFATLVRAILPQVRRMAMRFFSSPFDQEEALQEVFLQLHRHSATFDSERTAELPAYILTLARRRMIDLLRAKRPGAHFEELSEVVEETEDRSAPSAEEAVTRRELRDALSSFAAKLKPDLRAFFQLAFVEGKDDAEARSALRLSERRARYLRHVLLTRLRAHLPLRAFGRSEEER